jgi:hypothetical protein
MAMHPFLKKAQQRQPQRLSVYWNGRQILRIEQGQVVWEASVCPGFGLLTFHFDGDPYPVYVQVIDGA